MDARIQQLMSELDAVREPDGFNDQVKRVATLLSWGQDVSKFDPLVVVAATLFLGWSSN